MRDLRTEIYVSTRDSIEKLGVNQGAAIAIARQFADDPGLHEALRNDYVRTAYAPVDIKALNWAVARRIEKLITQAVKPQREKLESLLDKRGFDFDGFVDPENLKAMWRFVMGQTNRAVGDVEDESVKIAIIEELVKEPAISWYPLVLPIDDGLDGGFRLYYVKALIDLWVKYLASGEPIPVLDILLILHRIAALQWLAAGVLGSILGADRAVHDWLPYARLFEGERWQAVESGSPTVFHQDVPANLPLEHTWNVSKYVLYGKPLEVRALALSMVTVGGETAAVRLSALHPMIPQKGITNWWERMRRELRKTYKHTLGQEEEEFLQLVSELGGDFGRLPKGFWPRFQKEWQKRHPERKATVNSLRVKYHRLMKRMRT